MTPFITQAFGFLSVRKRNLSSLQFRLGWSFEGWILFTIIFIYFTLCILLCVFVEAPSDAGETPMHFGADTITYYTVADLLRAGFIDSAAGFVGLNGNLLGPVLFALLFRSPYIVMAANMGLFLLAIFSCGPAQGINRLKLSIPLMANAVTLVSIVSLNKEIFILISTLLFCRYVYAEHRSRLLLAAAMITGLFARLHQPLLFLLFLFLQRRSSFFRRRQALALAILVLSITAAYPVAVRGIDLSWATDQAAGGNTIIVLNKIQGLFGFPLVLLPKAAMDLFNRTLTPAYWFTEYPTLDFNDVYNQVVQNLSCFANSLLFLAAWKQGRLRVSRPVPFFCAIYIIILVSSPFLQPRYTYPIYVAMCFDLARKESLGSGFKLRLRPAGILPRLAWADTAIKPSKHLGEPA